MYNKIAKTGKYAIDTYYTSDIFILLKRIYFHYEISIRLIYQVLWHCFSQIRSG